MEKPAKSLHRFNYEIANLKNSLQLSSSMSALQVPANKSILMEERERSASTMPDTLIVSTPPTLRQICKQIGFVLFLLYTKSSNFKMVNIKHFNLFL